MEAAVHVVKSGRLSYRAASVKYDIPHTTICDHSTGASTTGCRPGTKPILSFAEEEGLAQWCMEMNYIGYGKTKEQSKDTVKKILDKEGRKVPVFKSNRPGRDWRPENLQISRAMACKEEKVMEWFAKFESFLEENNIHSSAQVANLDETGFSFQPGCVTSKVIVEKGIRNCYQVSSPSKEQIAMMVCAFANGNVFPPLHFYPGQQINSQWTQDSVPEADFSVTDKVWMETDVFYGWIANRFLNQIPSLRPIVLLLGGHESLIDIHVSKIWAKNKVLLFCLPPNCFHVLQPLDVGFFSSLKAH